MQARPFLIAAIAAISLTASPALAVVNDGPPSDDVAEFDDSAAYAEAVAAIETGHFAEAESLLNGLAERIPADANAQLMLGKAREGLGNLPGALDAFQTATRLDAHNLRAWAELGVMQVKTGNAADASATLADLKKQAAECGARCNDGPASIERLEAALDRDKGAVLDTSHDLLFASSEGGDQAYLSAVSLINQHRYEEALAGLREAERVFGPHPDVLTYIGFVNRKLGHHDLAEQYYQRALAAVPEHRGATEYYGELKVLRGDRAGARTLLTRLEALCPFGCAEADELRRWIDGAHTAS